MPMQPPHHAGSGAFLSTQWSMVLAAQQDSAAALELLCRLYWPAIHAFSRRAGDGPEEACDLTQGFFEQLLARRWLDQVDASRGRFRSFLLKAFTRFSRDEWRKSMRLKRGGGAGIVSLDEMAAEAAPADGLSPDAAYERRWAEALVAAVLGRLAAEYAAAGKAPLFESLRPHLTSPRGAVAYADTAAALGLSESGVKSAIFRMRQRYGELFREEVAGTVASRDEVDDEIRHLLAVMSNG